MSGGSGAPIENSPPGIHTIPLGGGPGGLLAFADVGRKAISVNAGADAALDGGDAVGVDELRVAAKMASAPITTTRPHLRDRLPRRAFAVDLTLLWRELLIASLLPAAVFHLLEYRVEVEGGRLLPLRVLLERH